MPQPNYETLGNMRHRLAVRLGYGAQGGAAATLKPILDDFLQAAQLDLHEEFSDMLLRDYVNDQQTVAGQVLYDIVEQADPQRINGVFIKRSSEWEQITQHLDFRMRNDDENVPSFYRIAYGTSGVAQLELNPTPNDEYIFGYEFIRSVDRFTQNEDKTSINSHLVFTLALADAKAHYKQQDSDRYTAKANSLLYKLRARKNAGKVVRRGTPDSPSFANAMGQIDFARDVVNA